MKACITCGKTLGQGAQRAKTGPNSRIKHCRSCFFKSTEFQEKTKRTQFVRGQIPYNKDKKLPELSGMHHPLWKGDDVGYYALHDWVTRHLGRPSKCEFCGTTSAPRFEWANKSGFYKRSLDDWIRLCKRCHNDYDGVNVQQNVAKHAA